MVAAGLLALALAGVVWFGWPRLRMVPRPRSHWRWIGRASVAFAGPALIMLAALDGWAALVALPTDFLPLARLLPRVSPIDLLPAIVGGLPLGGAIVLFRIRRARRRGEPVPQTIVAPAPLAARHRGELWPATATAIAAGITEELAFRLAIPLLVARLTGSPTLGFVAATAAFVALHRYQPWWGQLGVALSALVFIALYLGTGALWLAMLLHAAIDVMALAVRPWLAGFSSSAASRSGRSK